MLSKVIVLVKKSLDSLEMVLKSLAREFKLVEGTSMVVLVSVVGSFR